MGRPAAVTLSRILNCIGLPPELEEWLRDRRNRRIIPKHLGEAGYVYVHNPGNKQGLWKVDGQRQAVYARGDLAVKDQIAAARAITEPEKDTDA
jgi:hypothetical protein